ncbi:hypothetical protein IKR55_00335 [bacterium]|nr:hypothetical protein [Elusimicrobiota bacterium]MBR6301163.1 hypothetical protein [bacterium]
MEKIEERKVIINGRTFEDVRNDINEIVSCGFDQEKASIFRDKELSRMFDIYKQKADELNKAQENIQEPKVKYVAR